MGDDVEHSAGLPSLSLARSVCRSPLACQFSMDSSFINVFLLTLRGDSFLYFITIGPNSLI